jgi:hypothetical protein
MGGPRGPPSLGAPTARRFTKNQTLGLLNQAEQAFADWRTVKASLQADAFLIALLVQRQMRG